MQGSHPPVTPILEEARIEEKRCRWLKVAEIYADRLHTSHDLSTKAEALDRIGHAYFRASLQARGSEQFRRNVHRAIVSYRKARTQLMRLGDDGRSRAVRSSAMIVYLRFWLAREPSAKKRFVDDSWSLSKRAMKSFDKSHDSLGFAETFAVLSPAVPALLHTKWDAVERRAIFDEALEYGRRAIELLSPIGDKQALVKVYVRMALFIDTSREERGVVAEQEALDEEGRGYWRRALQIDKELALSELPRPPDGFYHLFDNEQGQKIWEECLTVAQRHRDSFGIGWLCDQLAGSAFWKALRPEDTRQCVKLAEKSLRLAERAGKIYSWFNYTAPRPGVLWAHSPYAEHFMQLSWFGIDPEKRRLLLTKSHLESVELLRLAQRTLFTKARAYAHHIASKARSELAELEANPVRKRRLMREALQNRKIACSIIDQTQPASLWTRGVYLTYSAQVKRNLAEMEESPGARKILLLDAVQTKRRALELCKKYVESMARSKNHPLYGAIARQYADYGETLTFTYDTLGGERHLADAANAFMEAIAWAAESGSQRGLAAYYWMASRAHDRLQDYSKAAVEFTRASKIYETLTRKVAFGHLYRDRIKYLMAWAKIEEARGSHTRLEYEKAAESYLKAADIFKSIPRWDFLELYYRAIGTLEDAEALSRLGEISKTIRLFEESIVILRDAKARLQTSTTRQDPLEEKNLIARLAMEPIADYCNARVFIEEARRAENQEDRHIAYMKFREASERLKKASSASHSVEERREFAYLASLAEGWGLMTLARIENSKQLFESARRKFEKAWTLGYNQNSRLLAKAYSSFCMGTEAADTFLSTLCSEDFETANRHLTIAVDCFKQSGFRIAHKQADAMRRLLAAKFQSIHVGVAGRVGRSPIGPITFPAPGRWGGSPSGFPDTAIEASIMAEGNDCAPGENIGIVVQVGNLGSKSVRLVRLDDAIPEGTEIIEAPPFTKVHGSSLLMDGRKLDPSSVLKIPVVLKVGPRGLVLMRPRLLFVDASRQVEMALQPKILAGFRTLKFLANEFILDSKVKQLAPAYAGWRTLMDLVSGLKVPRSYVYGDHRYGRRYGKHVEALLKSELVEVRLFPGERGRGGQITKVRISSDNDLVRQYTGTTKVPN